MTGGELSVRLGEELVGHLWDTGNGRLAFAYDSGWLRAPRSFPISLSLPLAERHYVSGAGHSFFANLLPEGGVRDAIGSRLGISPGNDFALLRAIGGECAGALSITQPDAPLPDPETFHYQAMDDDLMNDLVHRGKVVPLLVGGAATRLSLAGAQDKLPVAVLDGELHVPGPQAPSTHILKLPNPAYAHLLVNEAFVLGLARTIGLDTVSAQLRFVGDAPVLLVERYDRVPATDSWPVRRLHQEDLCQALGLSPSQKYEQEGGPTLVRAGELVREHVQQPLVDVLRLIEWQAFNIVSGNSDGHGKNLSLLYDSDHRLSLAPFYDLVSTREYPLVDRMLAMAVGERRDPDIVGPGDWQAFASALGIGARTVIDRARHIAESVHDALPAWTDEFRAAHGDQPILQTLPRRMEARARAVLRQLG